MKKNRWSLYMGVGLSAALLVLFSCSYFEYLKEKEVQREKVFSHKPHSVDNDMACTDCHAGAFAKERAGMPELSVCTGCHEETDAKTPVGLAMTKLKEREKTDKPLWRMVHAEGDLLFSHKTHSGIAELKAGKKTACAACHGKAGESEGLSGSAVAKMKSCMACHEKGEPAPAKAAEKPAPAKEAPAAPKEKGKEAEAKKDEPAPKEEPAPAVKTGKEMTACSFCHSEWRQDVKPAGHKALWRVTHGEEIRFGIDKEKMYYCRACHGEDLCVRCHQVEKPRSHTEFFRTRGHGIEAEVSRERCSTCHRQDFCIHCHSDTRPRSHTASWGLAPYRHCNDCHMTMSGTSCGVCHKAGSASIAAAHAAKAPLYPKDLTHAANCTMECHTSRHPDPGPTCKNCHK